MGVEGFMKWIYLKQPFLVLMIGLLIIALLILFLHTLKKKNIKKTILLISFPFCSSAFLLYFLWGAPLEVIQRQALDRIENKLWVLTQDKNVTLEKIKNNLAVLEKDVGFSHLGLARLGEIYITLGLFDNAAKVFEKATVLCSMPAYWTQWIYSHSMSNQGKLPSDVRQKALELIKRETEQKILLNLLAIDDYFQGNYQEAISRWQTILETDPSLTDERRLTLQQAINTSYKALGVSPSLANSLRFQVSVSLASDLKNKALPNESVFVFVKSTDGSAVPLAVVRKKVFELPFTVDLSQAPQMLPGQSLSLGKEIVVIAKISKSGDPLDKKGDLQGMTNKLVLHSQMEPVLLEINKVQS